MTNRLKKSHGNMYDWTTHVWSPISGCPHQCSYCYVRKFHDLPEQPRLDMDFPRLGAHKIIFVGHLCDMFAVDVPDAMIQSVLAHCRLYAGNQYVFQTKNPRRLTAWRERLTRATVGTTIETNREDIIREISRAPMPKERAAAMADLWSIPKFVTIEPILEFDHGPLLELVLQARPEFVNIGADSKNHRLPEPSRDKVLKLAAAIQAWGIEVRRKTNLERLCSRGL